MSDNENSTITASGSGKSPEEVAFELVNKLKGQGVWGERNVDAILDMYAKCLDATKGLRAYEGQTRVDVPIKTAAQVKAAAKAQAAQQAQAAAPVEAPVQAPAQAAPTQSAHVQPAQAPQAQPVHAQQQQIQQAYTQA